MKSPRVVALGVFLFLLSIWYVSSFTEWLRPEPIRVIAQFRPLPKQVLARRSERAAEAASKRANRTERPNRTQNAEPQAPLPDGGRVVATDLAPASPVAPAKSMSTNRASTDGERNGFRLMKGNLRDIQPFIFSLDGRYRLTSIKVVETSSTQASPPIAWWVRSKAGSPPTENILYGRAPESLIFQPPSTRADKLLPGRTYTLFLEAGRRRGEVKFSVPEVAEPAPPDDGDYHPEKDVR